MEDKILDDDIIDLTDLLEEGRPPRDKETSKSGTESKLSTEPDSFDLGKEISMEYDVSVEEIESSGEELDIDAALSSNEEKALAQDEISGEDIITLENAGENSEIERADDTVAVEEKVLSAGTPQPLDEYEFRGEPGMDTMQAGAETVEQEEATTEKEEDLKAEASAEPVATESTEDFSAGETTVPHMDADNVIAEFRQELPAMIEGIVRPFLAELVKEIISASREQLPGIVEKVIREEIEKLKKLNV